MKWLKITPSNGQCIILWQKMNFFLFLETFWFFEFLKKFEEKFRFWKFQNFLRIFENFWKKNLNWGGEGVLARFVWYFLPSSANTTTDNVSLPVRVTSWDRPFLSIDNWWNYDGRYAGCREGYFLRGKIHCGADIAKFGVVFQRDGRARGVLDKVLPVVKETVFAQRPSWYLEKCQYQSINQSNQSVNQSFNHSINQSINLSIYQSIDQSINQSIDRTKRYKLNMNENFKHWNSAAMLN